MNYIYLIQHKTNLKIYVGRTNNIKRRWFHHKHLSKNLTKNSQPIHQAMHLDGFDSYRFTVIEQHINQEDADEAEKFYIAFFQSRNKDLGYNAAIGGKDLSGWNHTNEAKLKISAKSKLQKLSPEHKAKLLASVKGVKHTEERRQKVSKARKGMVMSCETRQKISDAAMRANYLKKFAQNI